MIMSEKKTQEIHNKITTNHVERSTQLKEYSYPDNIWQNGMLGLTKKDDKCDRHLNQGYIYLIETFYPRI